MNNPITIFILTILFFFGAFHMFKKHLKRSGDGGSNMKLNLPPSPPKIPILGNFHQLTPIIHQCFYRMSATYGPLILLHWGKRPILVVASAETAFEITKTHDLVFADRLATKAANMIFCGGNDIILSPYGERWRQLRKFCVLQLLSLKRVKSFKYVREEEVDKVIQKIDRSYREGDMINLTAMLSTMSNSIIFRCSLGENFNEDYTQRFIELMKKATRLIESSFSLAEFFPCLKWMDIITGLDGKLRKISRELDTFFNQVLDDQILYNSSIKQSVRNKVDHKRNFIDILLHHAEKEPNLNLTRADMKAIIMDMFVGGSDSTATLLEWAMAELIKNPKLMKIAQEEVRRVVGKKMKVGEHHINQMDYLKCVVKECLRLHAPLPNLIPRNSSANVKIQGYHIPQNTGVFISAYSIHRDPRVWDKPEEFHPERFINNPIDFKGKDCQFIPFGSGRRRCPGMSFGLANVEFVLANLLYGFDWEFPGGANMEELDMTEGFGITINRKIPLLVVPIKFHGRCT